MNDIQLISQQVNDHIVHYNSQISNSSSVIISMPFFKSNIINIDSNDNIEYRTYSLLSSIADGLRCIHSLKLFHGNLKPTNVLIDENGNYLISDYRKNQFISYSNLPSIAISTYQYMSPEMIKSEECTTKTDLWSYGCVMYYILSGKPPFSGKSLLELQLCVTSCSYPPLESVFKNSLNPLLMQLLIVDPNKRIKIEEVIGELDRIRDSSGIDPLPKVTYNLEEIVSMRPEFIILEKTIQGVLNNVSIFY